MELMQWLCRRQGEDPHQPWQADRCAAGIRSFQQVAPAAVDRFQPVAEHGLYQRVLAAEVIGNDIGIGRSDGRADLAGGHGIDSGFGKQRLCRFDQGDARRLAAGINPLALLPVQGPYPLRRVYLMQLPYIYSAAPCKSAGESRPARPD